MKKYFLLVTSLLYYETITAQLPNKVLLNDPQLQFEITEAMNLMYNFKFDKADSAFNNLKKLYPTHPLPYLLLGYNYYWRIMPNEDVTIYDRKFLSYMDSVIYMAEKIFHKDEKNFESIFFLSAAYSFKGRILSDRRDWARATFAGKDALHYLKLSREYNDLSPEFLFGEGLFNYYAEWIPENFKAFRPIMWFFPKGNKEKGIKILKEACDNAFYTRTEAQHYYIKIMLYDQRKDNEALPMIKYLFTTYSLNPVFHRLFVRILFDMGQYNECQHQSEEILKRIDEKYPGYEEVSGRYASFYLGWINKFKNKEKAKQYFLKCVYFSEKINAVKMNYYMYSLDELAKYAQEEKDTKTANLYYQKIKDNADRSHELYKSSKKHLREND